MLLERRYGMQHNSLFCASLLAVVDCIYDTQNNVKKQYEIHVKVVEAVTKEESTSGPYTDRLLTRRSRGETGESTFLHALPGSQRITLVDNT